MQSESQQYQSTAGSIICVRQQGMLGIVMYVLYPCIVSYCITIIVTAGAFVCEDDRWGGAADC